MCLKIGGMKERETYPGKAYAVTTQSGCNVYADEAGTQLIKAVEAGQGYFVAIGSRTWVDDDAAIVTETFNGAARKLRLLAGGVKETLPAGYTRLEYLESNGRAYLKTTLLNNESTRIWAKFSIKSSRLGDDLKLYGAGAVALCTLWGYFREYTKKTAKTTADIWTAYNKSYKKGCNYCRLYNTVTKELFTTDDIWTPYPDGSREYTYVFAVYGWGGIDGRLVGKIYEFTGVEKTTKIRLVPCLDDTGTPCMYDFVSKSPFYNFGAGDFTYPSTGSSTTYSLRRPVAEYAKLTPHGVRRLYKLPDSYTGEPEQYIAENGFKRLVETEKPEEGYWEPVWRETDTELVLDWHEVEPPAELENEPEILTDTTQQ